VLHGDRRRVIRHLERYFSDRLRRVQATDSANTPNPSPPPSRQPKPRKPLWTLEKNGHTYRCELLFHEQGGTEAQILKDGELMYGRRFEEGWQTLQWAELEKEHIEKGGDDA
jgi:hypothetical protein